MRHMHDPFLSEEEKLKLIEELRDDLSPIFDAMNAFAKKHVQRTLVMCSLSNIKTMSDLRYQTADVLNFFGSLFDIKVKETK